MFDLIKAGYMVTLKNIDDIKQLYENSGDFADRIHLNSAIRFIEDHGQAIIITDKFECIVGEKNISIGDEAIFIKTTKEAIASVTKHLNISKKFYNVLKRWNNKKALAILSIDPEVLGINHLDIDQENKKQISYIDKNKELYIKENTECDLAEVFGEDQSVFKKYKRYSKIGRVLTKISRVSGIEITSKDIEKVQAICSMGKFSNFKIVSGEEIRTLYSSDNYCKCGSTGELSRSCMASPSKSSFFDIYVRNLKMLVLFCDNCENKILGRALLWENTINAMTGDTVKWIDRAFGTRETIELFDLYAKENGLLTKREIDDEGVGLYVEFPFDYISEYPYLDTMNVISIDGEANIIRLENEVDYDTERYSLLTATDGNMFSFIKCALCGDSVTEDEYCEEEEMCNECYENSVVCCDCCNEYFEDSEIIHVNGENLCHYCAQEEEE